MQLASPGAAGAILAVSALPRLALLLFGGAFVDRYGPRRLMIGSDLARGVVCLITAAVALAQPSVALLVAVALTFGLADALFLPAAGATLPRLLTPAQLTGGLALSGLTQRLALMLGAPLGGLLLPLGGLPLACLVNAITFGMSVLALWSVHPRPAADPGAGAPSGQVTPAAADPRAPVLAAVREGLRYLLRHPVLRATTLVSLLVNIAAAGPLNVGLALVADQRGWGAAGIGYLLAGFGAGAAAGSLLMVRRRPAGRVGVLAAACIVLQGGAIYAIAAAPALGWAAAATALGGLASGPLAVTLNGLTHTHTADTHRGRVTSINTLVSLGITPMAIAVMGFAAAQVGTVPSFAACTALDVLAAAACVTVPALRHATLTPS
ncbi:MFS transporter [Saccharothrix algeriensis]|uniref:MFS transporter n=1 Tax=Catellatospora bangladeshensis TaxID=310355 RepID=A0A8J3JDY0_9ACTN|nr:MFS transporter [Catellatospora bangladeshensis]